MTSWLAWITCPTCDRQLQFVTGGKATDEGRRITAIFECATCGTEEHLVATLDRCQLRTGPTVDYEPDPLSRVLQHAAGRFTVPQMVDQLRIRPASVRQAISRGVTRGALTVDGLDPSGLNYYRKVEAG